MTEELARTPSKVGHRKAAADGVGCREDHMTTIDCPWCQAELQLEPRTLISDGEIGCSECSSNWILGDDADDLALAA